VAASGRGRAAWQGHGARGRPAFIGARQGEAVPGTAKTAGRGVLTGHGGAWARMGFRAGSWPGRSGCGSDGLEGVKRWAGDEVKGGRADLGSWAVEKRRWAAVWELEGDRGGLAEEMRAGRETSGTGLKVAMGAKGGWEKEKKKNFFWFSEFYLREKNNLEVARYFIKSTKNILKIPKILGKFPETDWDMNNPNKVFGAYEKNFRSFNK
jgi:hypothetical protein